MSERTESTFTLRYSVERTIPAPPAALWARLTDGPGYPTWCSVIASIEGEIAPGVRLSLRVPYAPGRVFRPRVTTFRPEAKMVWQDGRFPFFQGIRTFTLTPRGWHTDFAMTEVFRGAMLPMIKGSLPDFREPFDRFAADLAAACG